MKEAIFTLLLLIMLSSIAKCVNVPLEHDKWIIEGGSVVYSDSNMTISDGIVCSYFTEDLYKKKLSTSIADLNLTVTSRMISQTGSNPDDTLWILFNRDDSGFNYLVVKTDGTDLGKAEGSSITGSTKTSLYTKSSNSVPNRVVAGYDFIQSIVNIDPTTDYAKCVLQYDVAVCLLRKTITIGKVTVDGIPNISTNTIIARETRTNTGQICFWAKSCTVTIKSVVFGNSGSSIGANFILIAFLALFSLFFPQSYISL